MKATHRIVALTLLASTAVFAACEEAPLAPTVLEAEGLLFDDVTTEAAPVGGVFETSVWYPSSACNTEAIESGGDFTIGTDGFFCIRVSIKLGSTPVTKGTVVFQVCDIAGPGSGGLEVSECETSAGQWVTFARVNVDPANGEAEVGSRYQSNSLIHPDGYRWRYIGKGSGVKNHSEPAFDVASSE